MESGKKIVKQTNKQKCLIDTLKRAKKVKQTTKQNKQKQ